MAFVWNLHLVSHLDVDIRISYGIYGPVYSVISDTEHTIIKYSDKTRVCTINALSNNCNNAGDSDKNFETRSAEIYHMPFWGT